MFEILLWCYSLPGVGSKMIRELHERFHRSNGAEDKVLSYVRHNGVASKDDCRHYEQRVRELKELISERKCSVIPYWERLYPSALKEIPDYPAFLFLKGIGVIPEICVGIVGTRAMTEYGKHVVRDLVAPLREKVIGIVSGLAYGIDREVHRASLDSPESQCVPVAVLPGGPTEGFPYGNRDVFSHIERRGCAIWEFLPGTELKRNLFACRNRLIAGLSRSVVVVESDSRGGSLITAQCALDYGREVCAVPGSVYSRVSRGTNNLLNEGARVVRDGYDVWCTLGGVGELGAAKYSDVGDLLLMSEFCKSAGVEEDQIRMLSEKMKSSGVSIQEIGAMTELDETKVRRILTKLELKGILRHNGAGLIICTERFA